jgi:hypothetical protein
MTPPWAWSVSRSSAVPTQLSTWRPPSCRTLPKASWRSVGRVGKASDVFGLGGILCVTLTGQPPYTRAEQVFAGDVREAFAHLDGCGADAELVGLAKACLAPAPEARPADAGEVAGRVKRYREEVAARQAQAERELWVRQVAGRAAQAAWQGEAFPRAVEAARARFRQHAVPIPLATPNAFLSELRSRLVQEYFPPADKTIARRVASARPRGPAVAARLRKDVARSYHDRPRPAGRCPARAAGHAALPFRGVPGPRRHGRAT